MRRETTQRAFSTASRIWSGTRRDGASRSFIRYGEYYRLRMERDMVSKKQGIVLLSGVPIFSELSQAELGALWSSFGHMHHAAGSTVLAEGRGGSAFHIIVSGEARVTRKRTKVTLGPGKFFGELTMIDQGPRTATVTAATELETATIDHHEFKSLLESKPKLAWKLVVHLSGRLREEQSIADGLTS